MNKFKNIDQDPKTTVIYILTDPIEEEVKYIGRTTRNLDKRLREHIKKACSKRHVDNTQKSKWIRELIKKGGTPKIQRIDKETCPKLAANLEKHYIKGYAELGYQLVNEACNDHSKTATMAIS